ncbi:substrate-binding domain-containing protein [Paenibacillus dauci]|uniref:substrate-binding domain-containing protein n=1 Tax=Paenibacillus dauci TaxID=1567106 RepID=UPI000619B7D7|nr:helix-turn-helix transcriptional regulator [Paenibacillus dauci]
MDEQVSYTTEEIARLLKVSKLTVYDLIKKGDLPAYRVGKQMRVDHYDLETYKQRAKNGMIRENNNAMNIRELQSGMQPVPSSSERALQPGKSGVMPATNPLNTDPSAVSAEFVHAAYARPEEILRNTGTMQPVTQDLIPPPINNQTIVITGQDTSLDLLARYMEKDNRYRPLRSFAGSMNSLVSMYMGNSDIVSTHLFDGDSGEYNLPYIRKILVSCPFTLINLASRPAGIYVQRGNPRRIRSWSDLSQPGLTIVNREKGAGARVLLDEQLRLHNIRPSTVRGYGNEETSHIAVAARIASGQADVGIGSERAATMVGIEFIPLVTERYDLVVLNKPDNAEWIALLKRILQSVEFKQELQAIGGYDLSRTGEIVYESVH